MMNQIKFLGNAPTIFVLWVLFSFGIITAAQTIERVCPNAIQPRNADFTPTGILITAFDGDSLWVYDITNNTRYPLPDTAPCLSNCRVSPDFAWLTYIDPLTSTLNKMRFDGTQRTPLATDAADVLWWSSDTLLVWTAAQNAYLQPEDTTLPTTDLLANGVIAVQPQGYAAVALTYRNGEFWRVLLDLQTRYDPTATPILLGPDVPYYNGLAWSPDGSRLVYVGRGATNPNNGAAGGELFVIQPNQAFPQQITFFNVGDGPMRIGGYARNGLVWSPDGTRLAFWAAGMVGPNPETDTGQAMVHVWDSTSNRVTAYCAFMTTNHTPNPTRLVWSPDGTHIAFAGDVLSDGKGFLLLALDVNTGQITELSDGIYPALDVPQVVGWGVVP